MNHAIIEDVSDTAFWVAYFREKETARAAPMFRDPYAQMLAGTRGKAFADAAPKVSRYTEWTVIARTVIIDRFIEQAIRDGVDAVINMGAGLDARPYRMKLPANLRWVEADYPKIIEHKNNVLKSETPTCLLTRIGIDLADVHARQNFLEETVPDANNVLILTEGVIPYLAPDEVALLAQDLFSQKRIRYWIAEFIRKDIYKYLQMASSELKNSPFKFFPEEWYPFFAEYGWIEKQTRHMVDIAVEFKRTMPLPLFARVIMSLLPKKVKDQALRSSGFVLFTRNA